MDPLLAALALVGCRLVRSDSPTHNVLRIIHPSERTCFYWLGSWSVGDDVGSLIDRGVHFAECDWREVIPLTTKDRNLLTGYLLNAAPHGA